MFFEGTELEDDRLLSSYNIKTGSIVNLRVQHGSAIQVHVQTLAGRPASVNVHRSDTIKTIYKMLEDKWIISAGYVRLIYAGKQLDNNKPDLTLADYNVQDGDKIYIGTLNSSSHRMMYPPNFQCSASLEVPRPSSGHGATPAVPRLRAMRTPFVRDAFRKAVTWCFISLIPWSGVSFILNLFLSNIEDTDRRDDTTAALPEENVAASTKPEGAGVTVQT